MYLWQPVFAVLRSVRSLASQAEVCAVMPGVVGVGTGLESWHKKIKPVDGFPRVSALGSPQCFDTTDWASKGPFAVCACLLMHKYAHVSCNLTR